MVRIGIFQDSWLMRERGAEELISPDCFNGRLFMRQTGGEVAAK